VAWKKLLEDMMSNPSGFTWQSWDDTENEALASQRRDESEQSWIDGFMTEATEIDIELKQLRKELDHGYE